MTKVFTMIAMLALALSLAAQTKPSPSIAGKWTMTMEMSMGTATPALEFRQEGEKITGSYTGRYGVSPLEGTLKGLALQFTVKMEAEGQVVLLGFSGEVAADGQTMKGKAVLGDLGEGPWTAKKEKSSRASTVRSIPGIVGGIVFSFSLGIYLLTLAPTVTLVDSGELIVAARTLGVAHPPGFPLYILLAHLASLAPLGSVAMRVNAASALFGALAAATAALAAYEALQIPSGKRPSGSRSGSRGQQIGKKAAAGEAAVDSLPPLQVALPALLAGLLFCLSRTLWAYATLAEVYTLDTSSSR